MLFFFLSVCVQDIFHKLRFFFLVMAFLELENWKIVRSRVCFELALSPPRTPFPDKKEPCGEYHSALRSYHDIITRPIRTSGRNRAKPPIGEQSRQSENHRLGRLSAGLGGVWTPVEVAWHLRMLANGGNEESG